MKRVAVITGFLSLFLGFFIGTLLPSQLLPWKEADRIVLPSAVSAMVQPANSKDGANGASSDTDRPAFDSRDNSALLSSAYTVAQAIQSRDYDTLAAAVHPERGVTFTPYSTVNFDTDLTFNADQIKQFGSDHTVYNWGFVDGRGSLIEQTPKEYLASFVATVDYTQASELGVDHILQRGNALENVAEAYPDCRFVEFHFAGLDPANAGLDWCSLKLVFAPTDRDWRLVGIINSRWTI